MHIFGYYKNVGTSHDDKVSSIYHLADSNECTPTKNDLEPTNELGSSTSPEATGFSAVFDYTERLSRRH